MGANRVKVGEGEKCDCKVMSLLCKKGVLKLVNLRLLLCPSPMKEFPEGVRSQSF